MHPRLFLSIIRNLLPLTRYPYHGEESPCPVCQCDTAMPVAGIDRRFKKLPTVACSGCGLFYTNPMPTDPELDRYYQHFYRFDYQWRISAPSERHQKKRRSEADLRLSRIRDLLAPGASTLDFGTGSGEFISAMREAGFDAHGFEPGETYGSFARELHQDRVIIDNWQTVEYHQSSFDMISAFHVMEHLADPVAAIRKAAGWLKPGGFFYIEVPDMPGSFSAKGLGAFHFAHLVGFNHANLCLAAAMAGMVPVRIISETGIVFKKTDEPQNLAVLGERGRSQTDVLLAMTGCFSAFARHTFSKLKRKLSLPLSISHVFRRDIRSQAKTSKIQVLPKPGGDVHT